jgi:hypothetical protein
MLKMIDEIRPYRRKTDENRFEKWEKSQNSLIL